MNTNYTENLFSYGTLRYENVQRETFGRKLDGHDDKLVGYVMKQVQITDKDVIEKSGQAIHSILYRSGNPKDLVPGVVFKISKQELENADKYEVDDYKRIEVKLNSGTLVLRSVNSVKFWPA